MLNMQRKLVKGFFLLLLYPCTLWGTMMVSSGVSSSAYYGKTRFSYLDTNCSKARDLKFTTRTKLLQPDHCYRYGFTVAFFGIEGEWLKSQKIYEFIDENSLECTQRIRYLLLNGLMSTPIGIIRLGVGRVISKIEGEFPDFTYAQNFYVPVLAVGVEARYSMGGGFFCFVDTKWTFFQASGKDKNLSWEMSSIGKHTIAGIGCQF